MEKPCILRNGEGAPIRSLEDWLKHAPPQREGHWKDLYSAKEFAKAWFRNGDAEVPVEISILLNSHPATRGYQCEWATPEAKTALDGFKGNTRNNDLISFGYVEKTPTVLAFEAKVQEPFGDSNIGDYRRSKCGEGSKVPERISLLSRAVFGRDPDAEIDALRYQLLHGFAASLIEAKRLNAVQAVFIVHEFHHARVDGLKVKQNHRELERFIQVLSKQPSLVLETGRVLGPFDVPGGSFVPSGVAAYVGKTVAEIHG